MTDAARADSTPSFNSAATVSMLYSGVGTSFYQMRNHDGFVVHVRPNAVTGAMTAAPVALLKAVAQDLQTCACSVTAEDGVVGVRLPGGEQTTLDQILARSGFKQLSSAHMPPNQCQGVAAQYKAQVTGLVGIVTRVLRGDFVVVRFDRRVHDVLTKVLGQTHLPEDVLVRIWGIECAHETSTLGFSVVSRVRQLVRGSAVRVSPVHYHLGDQRYYNNTQAYEHAQLPHVLARVDFGASGRDLAETLLCEGLATLRSPELLSDADISLREAAHAGRMLALHPSSSRESRAHVYASGTLDRIALFDMVRGSPRGTLLDLQCVNDAEGVTFLRVTCDFVLPETSDAPHFVIDRRCAGTPDKALGGLPLAPGTVIECRFQLGNAERASSLSPVIEFASIRFESENDLVTTRWTRSFRQIHDRVVAFPVSEGYWAFALRATFPFANPPQDPIETTFFAAVASARNGDGWDEGSDEDHEPCEDFEDETTAAQRCVTHANVDLHISTGGIQLTTDMIEALTLKWLFQTVEPVNFDDSLDPTCKWKCDDLLSEGCSLMRSLQQINPARAAGSTRASSSNEAEKELPWRFGNAFTGLLPRQLFNAHINHHKTIVGHDRATAMGSWAHIDAAFQLAPVARFPWWNFVPADRWTAHAAASVWASAVQGASGLVVEEAPFACLMALIACMYRRDIPDDFSLRKNFELESTSRMRFLFKVRNSETNEPTLQLMSWGTRADRSIGFSRALATVIAEDTLTTATARADDYSASQVLGGQNLPHNFAGNSYVWHPGANLTCVGRRTFTMNGGPVSGRVAIVAVPHRLPKGRLANYKPTSLGRVSRDTVFQKLCAAYTSHGLITEYFKLHLRDDSRSFQEPSNGMVKYFVNESQPLYVFAESRGALRQRVRQMLRADRWMADDSIARFFAAVAERLLGRFSGSDGDFALVVEPSGTEMSAKLYDLHLGEGDMDSFRPQGRLPTKTERLTLADVEAMTVP